MTSTWVLIMVTAISPHNFEVHPLMQTDTMAQCYFQSTVAEFDIATEKNRELLCMQVTEE
jgi:hypothetical protein